MNNDNDINAQAETSRGDGNAASNVTQPARNGMPSRRDKKKKYIVFVVLSIVAVILIGALAYGVFRLVDSKSSHGGTASVSCEPQRANEVNDTKILGAAYRQFIDAVKSGDQRCVDSLSTEELKVRQVTTYGATDGNWISKKMPVTSNVDDMKALPDEISDGELLIADYVRPDLSNYPGLKASKSATGKTVGYKISTPNESVITVSFVVQGGALLADQIQSTPKALLE